VKQLLDGDQLDGKPFAGASLHLAAFVAEAGAAAMAFESFASTRTQAYEELIAWDVLLGVSEYYNKSCQSLGR
jgi:hypothetical protein